MSNPRIVFATDTAVTGPGVSVIKGSHWFADDPTVKAYPSLFADDPRYGVSASPGHLGADGYPAGYTHEEEPPASGHAETTTAAPGEHRSRKSPAK